MAVVNSVSGSLNTADLGFTLMHEHIAGGSPGVEANFHVWDRQQEMETVDNPRRVFEQQGAY